jgi:hypothetical protein
VEILQPADQYGSEIRVRYRDGYVFRYILTRHFMDRTSDQNAMIEAVVRLADRNHEIQLEDWRTRARYGLNPWEEEDV